MLVQLRNLFLLETKLQSDRLLNLCRQVSCQRRGVSASSSTVFSKDLLLGETGGRSRDKYLLQPLEHAGSFLFILTMVPSHTIPVAGNPNVNWFVVRCLPTYLMKGRSANIWARHQRCSITKLRSTPHCFSALSLLGRRVFSGPLLSSFSEPKVAYTGWPLIARVTAVSFPPHHTTWTRKLYKKFSSQTAQCKSEAASDSNKN